MRKILIFAFCGILCLTFCFFYGYMKGKKAERLEWQSAADKVAAEIAEKQAIVNNELSEALKIANEKKSAILDDYVKLRNAYDGLRSAATAIKVFDNSAAAASEAAARGELLAECAKEYGAMAKAADEHAADAMNLYNAWAKVYNKAKAK